MWPDSVYDACAAPFPFVVQRSGGGWRSAPLSIAGLPSLKAIDLEACSTGTSVELAYTTQGSGTFRGTTSW